MCWTKLRKVSSAHQLVTISCCYSQATLRTWRIQSISVIVNKTIPSRAPQRFIISLRPLTNFYCNSFLHNCLLSMSGLLLTMFGKSTLHKNVICMFAWLAFVHEPIHEFVWIWHCVNPFIFPLFISSASHLPGSPLAILATTEEVTWPLNSNTSSLFHRSTIPTLMETGLRLLWIYFEKRYLDSMQFGRVNHFAGFL